MEEFERTGEMDRMGTVFFYSFVVVLVGLVILVGGLIVTTVMKETGWGLSTMGVGVGLVLAGLIAALLSSMRYRKLARNFNPEQSGN